jgi:arylsulfatase A-like enzyme
MKTIQACWVAVACLLAGASASADAAEGRKPNVLVLYLDDMGWAQPGAYGGKLAPTPHIDAIARNGVRFTDGYVSACVCSPSRVGLMTGRYQSRTGHDANTTRREGSELDLRETTIAQRMKEVGYVTGLVGKWHLGDSPQHLPGARGFDYALGTVSNLGEGGFYRGTETIKELPGAPVTSPVFAREAIGFIERQREKAWFLTVAFNAVHAPHVASERWLEKFKDRPRREQGYAANIAEADEAIGAIMAALRERGLEEQTLVFVISDNGGANDVAEMGGLRGRKWLVWEGGVRVTWLAQWKGRIPAGRVSGVPVIQLDVLPTALAAAGVAVRPEWKLDGVNLLPLLEGRTERLEREALFWRFGVQYAVRAGDWKLVKASVDMQPMLVNLAADPGEKIDLAARHPDKVRELQALWDKWNAGNLPPRWEDRRWNGEEARAERAVEKKARKEGRRKRKDP